MSIWVIVVVIALVASFLAESEMGKIALTAIVGAIACLIVYWITSWAFMLTLAKICAVVVVLIAAISILSFFFKK